MYYRLTKPTIWHVRPSNTQLSLGIRPVWLQSSLCATVGSFMKQAFFHADGEDSSDQYRWVQMLICRIAGFVMQRLKS